MQVAGSATKGSMGDHLLLGKSVLAGNSLPPLPVSLHTFITTASARQLSAVQPLNVRHSVPFNAQDEYPLSSSNVKKGHIGRRRAAKLSLANLQFFLDDRTFSESVFVGCAFVVYHFVLSKTL